MSNVQVMVIFGVKSVAVTTRRALRVRYTTPVPLIRTVSPVGLTTTVIVAVPVSFGATLLVAVTVKVRGSGALSGGRVGAVKVWIEPSAAAGTRITPAGAVQVKVSVPPAGSIPVAVRAAAVALANGLAGLDAMLTTGGALAGGGTTGTSTVAGVENGTSNPSPTTSEKVRVWGSVTSGATNVGLAAVVLLSATVGSPALIT